MGTTCIFGIDNRSISTNYVRTKMIHWDFIKSSVYTGFRSIQGSACTEFLLYTGYKKFVFSFFVWLQQIYVQIITNLARSAKKLNKMISALYILQRLYWIWYKNLMTVRKPPSSVYRTILLLSPSNISHSIRLTCVRYVE